MGESIKVTACNAEITAIQNAVWAAYKKFLTDKDMRDYNNTMYKLLSKYQANKPMRQFVDNLRFAWAPVINAIKQESEEE